jgi:hypothetical protein
MEYMEQKMDEMIDASLYEQQYFTPGSKIKLGVDIEDGDRVYNKGHIFTIMFEDMRGLSIVDNDGNEIYECGYIQHTFIPYDIKEERKDKLNEIRQREV